jgi:hypothetical protein
MVIDASKWRVTRGGGIGFKKKGLIVMREPINRFNLNPGHNSCFEHVFISGSSTLLDGE